MRSQAALEELLRSCTLRLDADGSPQGTAFFVAPGLAVTAAHLLRDATRVELHGKLGPVAAQVEDVCPSTLADAFPGDLAPAPDIALIRVRDGPSHSCVLLSEERATAGTPVLARGYSRTFDGENVTAESEHFTVSGELNVPRSACVLLKLGQGQAVKGMSGAPVLSLDTGEIIGMVRSSRDLDSDLGAWIVPSPEIRRLWPQISHGHDRFHDAQTRWRWMSQALVRERQARAPDSSPGQRGPLTLGRVDGPLVIFHDNQFGDVHFGSGGPSEASSDGGDR